MLRPRHIPTEPGCCVLRVTQPVTEFERTWMSMGAPVWRISLWRGGVLFSGGLANTATPPSLQECLVLLSESPCCWQRVEG